MALASGGGSVDHGDHVRLWSPVPVAAVNGLMAVRESSDPASLAAAVLRFEAGGPWAVTVRNRSDLVRRAVESRGLTRLDLRPLLVRSLVGFALEARNDGAQAVVRAADRNGDTEFAAAMADGFGVERAVMGLFGSPQLLGAPNVLTAAVQGGDGVAAVAMGFLWAGTLGIANVATVPRARRQGFATLALDAVLRLGAEAGATSAYLHASADGIGLYRRSGFETAEMSRTFQGD
ncbi:MULTISPECIES: GNAT family N-acetyltransferase [unclassified Curtobacterium]|uniref:GNAT family N-acetyltransferase n=1 Tax=unclassified Curtobacterium TaxID=257496 RepID=UPI0015E89D46|nr:MULTISPECIES: GNAT family N-acetyltransferase [unclassified Curtobacterium]